MVQGLQHQGWGSSPGSASDRTLRGAWLFLLFGSLCVSDALRFSRPQTQMFHGRKVSSTHPQAARSSMCDRECFILCCLLAN